MPANFDRSKTKVVKTTYYDYHFGTGALLSTNVVLSDRTSEREYRNFIGTRTPNFKAFRSQNGYLPTLEASDTYDLSVGSPCVQRIISVVDQYGSLNTTKKVESSGYTPATSPPDVPDSLLNEAWSRVRQKVLNQDFNAPVFIAEAGKTVSMIAQTATRVFKAYGSFRKGRFREVATYLGVNPKVAHNTWLEYKYGWMPLLHDIHGAAKTLAELNFRRDQSTFRSTVKQVVPNYLQGSHPVVSGTLVHTAKAWVTVRVHNSNTTLANQLGLLNPSLVVWEIIPFSFVVDWFVNIGDCLAELTAFSGVTVLTGGGSKRVDFTGEVKEGNYYPYDVPLRNSFTYRKYHRTPSVQTLPRLVVKSDPLNLSKLITAVALGRQQVGKPTYRR